MVQKKNKLVRNKINISTQQYIDIAEIKEDIVIMRDGTLRAVLLISSINFGTPSVSLDMCSQYTSLTCSTTPNLISTHLKMSSLSSFPL